MDFSNKHPNENGYFSLDYTLSTIEERTEYVNYIINNTNQKKLTNYYLQKLTDYILNAEKTKEILTPNRMATINKREVSIESIEENIQSEKCNGAELINGIFNRKQDKNKKLIQKDKITEKDIESIPELKQLQESMKSIEKMITKASGIKKFKLIQQLITMRKEDQYIIRDAYKKPIRPVPYYLKNTYDQQIGNEQNYYYNEYDGITIDKDGNIKTSHNYTYFNIEYIQALCNNYFLLREWADEHCGDNLYYTYKQFNSLVEDELKPNYPFFYKLLIYKNQGLTADKISVLLKEEFNKSYCSAYYTILWRKQLPLIISKIAKKNFIDWYYIYKEKGKYKKCCRCGEIKLCNKNFFSQNKSSPDGFYSICKQCRSKKYYEKKGEKAKCQK